MNGATRRLQFKGWGWFLVALLLVWQADLLPAQNTAPPQPPGDSPNLIEGFFRALFGGGQAPKPKGAGARPATGDANNRSQGSSWGVVDIHAVHDPLLQRAVDNVSESLERGNARDAITTLQQLLEMPHDSLGISDTQDWESIQRQAERLIGRLPPSATSLYQSMYATEAQQMLESALRTGRLEDLAAITRRFFHTPAGYTASDQIGTILKDRGETLAARWWLTRLVQADAPVTRSEEWRRKAAQIGVELQQSETPDPVPSGPQPASARNSPPSADWTTPFGSAVHHMLAPNGDPTLIDHWSLPTTSRHETSQQVEQIQRDLSDVGRTCIPAAIPLTVQGTTVFRTLTGLKAVDTDSGRPLWESPELISVERLLAGDPIAEPAGATPAQRPRAIGTYHRTAAESHALAHLLYLDGVYGLISSDGEHVFVLENHATLSYRQPGFFWRQQQQTDPYDRDWSSNSLAAYGLRTGQLRWRVGGTTRNDAIDPQFAGIQFCGPPVPRGDELFLIGERHGTISLFVLDRLTGALVWSHPLATSSPEIDEDLVRRWWPAIPAISDDLIVCPTNVGWLVAIDRLERRIRWASRYVTHRQPDLGVNGTSVASAGNLNSRWCPAAPMLLADRIVYTPLDLPESRENTPAVAICWDASTGEMLWQRPKESRLYVIGVNQQRLLFVSPDRVDCCTVELGLPIWSLPIPADDGPPAGRGVVTTDDLLLPLQSGQLWRVRLQDGAVTDKIRPAQPGQHLGNLVFTGSRLLSLTTQGLTCFGDRASIEARIASLRRDDDHHLQAVRLEALLHLSDDDPEAALRVLARTSSARDPDDPTLSAIERESLLRLIQQTAIADDDTVGALERIARAPEERLRVRQLQAESCRQRQEWTRAFDLYWGLQTDDHPEFVVDGPLRRQFDVWLSTQLRRIWEEAGESQREIIDQRIADLIDALPVKDSHEAQRLSRVLSFHGAGRQLEQQLMEQAMQSNRVGETEIRLLRLLGSAPEEEDRIAALEVLAHLASQTDRPHDAAMFQAQIRDVEEHFGRDESASQDPASESSGTPVSDTREDDDWSTREFRLERRAATRGVQGTPAISISHAFPSFDRVLLESNPGMGRLRFIDADCQETIWETPLSFQSQAFGSPVLGLAPVGTVLMVVHRGVLHPVSFVDRNFLWNPLRFAPESAISTYERTPTTQRPQPLQTGTEFVAWQGLRRMQTPTGMLAVARPEYLAIHGRGELNIVDPVRGETLWTRSRIPQQAMVHGNSRLLIVVPQSPAQPFALRACDGVELDVEKLSSLVSRGIALEDAGVITMETRASLGLGRQQDSRVRITLTDDTTSDVRWELEFPGETRFSLLDPHQLVSLDPSGDLRLTSLATGKSQPFSQIDSKLLNDAERVFVLRDPRFIYVVLASQKRINFYGGNYLTAIPADGTLLAYHTSGDLAWQRKIEGRELILDYLQLSPVLIMVSRQEVRKGNVRHHQVGIEMLDKSTGRVLLLSDTLMLNGTLRQLDLSLRDGTIELRSNSERLMIRPRTLQARTSSP